MAAAMVKTSTPGIFKRGGRYVVVYRDPSGTQRKRSARTLAEARAKQAELRADVARGEYRTLSRATFGEYALEWIESYQGRTSRGVGDGTRADYRDALERLAIPFFGHVRLAAVEPRDVKRYAAHLAADLGLAPASVAKAVAPVRALFATAVEDGLIRSNPAAGLRIARRAELDEDGEVAEQVKALTEDERRALFAELPDERRPFFRFLFETGVRIGEAIEVRWRDVDLGGRWLAVDRQFYRGRVQLPKGGKRRRVRLGEDLARELWRLRAETRAGDDALVFTAERGGRLIPSNLMSRVLKPAAARAGLGTWVGRPARAESWVGFHTLRHSCATALFRSGWNAVQVQRFLGHSDPGFTLRTCVHLLDDDLPEVPFAAPGGNTSGNQTGRDAPKGTFAAEAVTATISREIPDAPRQAERLAANS